MNKNDNSIEETRLKVEKLVYEATVWPGKTYRESAQEIVKLIDQAYISGAVAELERIIAMSGSSDTMVFAKDMPLKGKYYAVYGKLVEDRLKSLSKET